MELNDTIAAVSTPRGKGGVALLRVSGDEALAVSGRVFRPANGMPLEKLPPRTSVYGRIYSTEPDGSVVCIDDGLAVFYRAPYSFTGEDTVEICCHGGILITESVLGALLSAGARQAEAGEFTRRAFVNGKIKLSEAEALGSLLEAKTHEQLRLSRSGLGGALSSKTSEIYEELRRLVGNIYALVDFPDEDLSALSRDELTAGVGRVYDSIISLASTYRTGRAISEGIKTVICGRTNSGKSSLYNSLLGTDAAIVTDIEGTTRDTLEDTASVGGVTLRLCDTAGLRESNDEVERLGIDRARRKIADAELILVLFDSSRRLSDEDERLAGLLESTGAAIIPILTKSDISPATARVPERLEKYSPITISTKTGDGLDRLAARVREMFIDGNIDISTDAVAATARQYAALTRAAGSVRASLDALGEGLPEDICCSDLEVAMAALTEIDGREVTADIVAEIFSKFCVGK